MANKELRMRLGHAASVALDAETLDLVHKRLMESEGSRKIPITLKYVFSVDDDDVLEVELVPSAAIPLKGRRIKLKSRGDQLTLWDPALNADVPDAPPATPKPKATAKPVARPKATAKKRAASPKKAKRAMRHKPTETAEKRLATILKNNEELYRSGAIDRDQAEAAGVDVEALDVGKEIVRSGLADLSAEEIDALDELVDA